MPDVTISFSQTAYDKLIAANTNEAGVVAKLKDAARDQILALELGLLAPEHADAIRDLRLAHSAEDQAKSDEVDGWFS